MCAVAAVIQQGHSGINRPQLAAACNDAAASLGSRSIREPCRQLRSAPCLCPPPRSQQTRGGSPFRRHHPLASTAAAGRSLEFTTSPTPGRSGAASTLPIGSRSLKERLAGLGLAGVVAYGLLNTLYYTAAFYFVWRYVARVPRGMGIAATAAKFAEVLGLTWGGSQLTKVPRAAGAIALAPAVDVLLTSLQGRLQLRSRRAAFGLVLGVCLAMAAMFYSCVLLAWS